MSFKFGFSGDDIEDDVVDDSYLSRSTNQQHAYQAFINSDISVEADYIPRLYTLEDLLIPQSPIRMSYSIVNVNGKGDHSSISIPRRDVYDVKYQLMRQESLSATDEILLGSTNEDVRAATYEGGLKVWECSFDLIEVLSQQQQQPISTVLELGCGAALPSSFILHHLLTKPSANDKRIRIVLADYNESVLRLVTAPNMLLTWVNAVDDSSSIEAGKVEHEIDITPELIKKFQTDLDRRGIELEFISGAWSPQFVRLLQPKGKFQLILASETIYSLDTLPIFTDTLLNCIDSSNGYALVAAKKIYFGVGGGIPDFINELQKRGSIYTSVFEDASGVGRAVLKVTLPTDY